MKLNGGYNWRAFIRHAAEMICLLLVCISTNSLAQLNDPETQADIRRCRNMSDADGQIHFCTKLIEKFGIADRSALSAWNWYRANAFMAKEKYSESKADFDESIRLRPDIYLWYVGRGRLYDKLNNFSAALTDFDKSIQLNPAQPDAYYFRGLAYEHHGDVERAIKDYTDSVKRDRSYGPPLERLAALTQGRKERTTNSKCCLPAEAAQLNQRAETFVQQGKYGEAEALLKRALAIAEANLGADDPEIINLLSNLGEATRRQRHYVEARSYMDRAVAMAERLHGPRSLRTATALVDLSLLDLEEDRFDDSKPLAEKAFSISRAQPSKAVLLAFLTLFSEKYAAKNRCVDAKPLLMEAWQIYQGNSNQIVSASVQKLQELSQKCSVTQPSKRSEVSHRGGQRRDRARTTQPVITVSP